MKKIISILLTLAMLACFTPAVLAASLGDIDADGHVTAGDARLALRSAVELEPLTAAQKARADADADGSVTAADARLILRVAVGLSEISGDGTHIVDKQTAGEKLRDYLIANGNLNDYGQYGLPATYEVGDDTIDVATFYIPGLERPLGIAVYYEEGGYLYESQILFNMSCSSYYIQYLGFDSERTQIFGIEYEVAHTTLSYDTAGASVTRLRGAGDEDDPGGFREEAGYWAFVGLRLLLEEIANAGLNIDYASDMHLYRIYD